MEDGELERFLDAVYERFHYDFRSCAKSALLHRVHRARIHFGCASISELREKMLRDETIFDALLDHLTVRVTDMFRDPKYFQFFRDELVPALRTFPALKIWIAGCGSGEEAYAFAVLLAEEELLDRTMIYATDISPSALKVAEAGVYPVDRVRKFTEHHAKTGAPSSLAEFYTAAYGFAIFDRRLKKHITFSQHSLASDGAFAEVNVLSCRNVLISFNRALQERAIGLFRESVRVGGHLGIGSHENMQSAEFVALSAHDRWFQKRER